MRRRKKGHEVYLVLPKLMFCGFSKRPFGGILFYFLGDLLSKSKSTFLLLHKGVFGSLERHWYSKCLRGMEGTCGAQVAFSGNVLCK